MENYREFIESLAKNDQETFFVNSGKDHAEIVLSTIFNSTKSKLRIFANSLTSDLASSEKYINSLKSYLEKGGELLVLLQKFEPESNKKLFDFFTYFQYKSPGKIQIKQSSVSLKNTKTEKYIHFTIGDDKIFRLEEDIEKYKAFGSFNDKKLSESLIQKFDDIFNSEKSKSLSLI